MWPMYLTFGVALIGAAVSTPAVRALSWRLGFVDKPAARKVHSKATPLLGGAAVAIGMLVAMVVGANLGLPRPGAGTTLGLFTALLLGLIDDRVGLGPGSKITGQLIAGGWFVLEGHAAHLTGLFPADVFLTLFWVVALMNAINFLDNMDGIAAGIGAVAGLSFAVLAMRMGDTFGAILGAVLAGACGGFLLFNFSPASIFLGDTGSLLVGAALARLSLGATHGVAHGAAHGAGFARLGLVPFPGTADPVATVAALLILAYPVFDITFVTAVRLLEGRKIYQGGRDHTTHRLDGLLKDHRATALVVYALCLVLSGIALAVHASGAAPVGLAVAAGTGVIFLGLGLGLARVAARPPQATPR
ncbi:MAG: undecaprenyl/decaprenyl-phosphate alpha-N-acetylglucosaminyl 1-phosphate transferase [Candidatus Eisenbacteria bacterium]|nr:undecaprenyl/decaprenyl-phosphate alpha-N-acetylglucosaminyl 1-phosphate transferase [Candidatus Eisenbacteria bacterium]